MAGENKDLHGAYPMENKVNIDINAVDSGGDVGMSVRKKQALDYLTPGDVAAQMSSVAKDFIVHEETDELYKGL